MIKTLLTKEELLSAVKGIALGNVDCVFCDVQTDSRKVDADKSSPNKCMFVPLIGEFQNGHKYISEVLSKNVSVILINKSEYDSNPALYDKYVSYEPNVLFVKVENTLHALQDAAECYATKVASNMIRVSITGSSGKTTTKEMLVSIAKEYYGEDKVAYTKGNLNSETGLPLSIFQIRGDEKIGIFEMGMNRENEIGEISKVWKSQYGIITNIGTAHIGLLGSRENIAKEKRKSFDYIGENGAAFVNEFDKFADFCLENVKGKRVKFGKTAMTDISCSPIENALSMTDTGCSEGCENSSMTDISGAEILFLEDKGLFGTVFSVDGVKIHLSLSGAYNFMNALSVIACAKELGIPVSSIKKGLESLTAIEGRMETKQLTLKNNKTVFLIKDCYNANLDSMTKVIDFCEKLKQIGKKIFVLADMKELGDESKKSHETIGVKINESTVDYVFLIGGEMKEAYNILEKKGCAHWYSSSTPETFESISKEINNVASNNDVILLKGSHSMNLEKLVPVLEKD